MRIIFLGTPAFAVPSLDILVQNGYDIAAVITAPGKQAGRGLQVKQSAIKEYADSKGIKTLQPLKLNDPEFLEEVRSLKTDLQIVVAFRMMPEALWNMPPHGTVNLHGSLLPNYRGAAPINRAIMNGELMTGVTTFFLKHEIDTGNILFRTEIPIGPDTTAGELHDEMMHVGAELILKTVKAIENGTAAETPQQNFVKDGEILKPAPKLFPEDFKIDWNHTAGSIHNQIRGLSPFPGSFTGLNDLAGNKIQLKIYRSHLTGIPSSDLPGTLSFENGRFFISCNGSLLEILELQQEGKKRMDAKSFLLGFRKDKGWKAS